MCRHAAQPLEGCLSGLTLLLSEQDCVLSCCSSGDADMLNVRMHGKVVWFVEGTTKGPQMHLFGTSRCLYAVQSSHPACGYDELAGTDLHIYSPRLRLDLANENQVNKSLGDAAGEAWRLVQKSLTACT